MTKERNIQAEIEHTETALKWQLGAAAGAGGYYSLIIPTIFNDWEPTVPTFEETEATFLAEKHEECLSAMQEDADIGYYFCIAGEGQIQEHHETVVAQAEADLAHFQANVAPYEFPVTSAIALGFALAVAYFIAKPTYDELQELRQEAQPTENEGRAPFV